MHRSIYFSGNIGLLLLGYRLVCKNTLASPASASVYRTFANNLILYELDTEATEDIRGLWGLPEAQRVPPWE